MTRVSIAALALGILVAGSAGSARASTEDCMCVLAQPDWAPLEWERAPQSVEVGPFFSSDGSLLVSRAELEGEAPRVPAPVLWCASPDDPRCSGRDGPPDRGPRTGDASHGAASHALDDSRFGPPGPSTSVAYAVGGGPRAGARHRIDRPPQR